MRIRVYQINETQDKRNLRFMNHKFTEKHGDVDPAEYKCVFNGYVDGDDLEEVYSILNSDKRPGNYIGYSLSVSDVVSVLENTRKTEQGKYFCDSLGFDRIDFDEKLAEPLYGIRCIEIQPNKPPFETRIEDKLKCLQRAVSDHGEDAYIEFTYPFDDNAIVLGNEEAKLIGMRGNRKIEGSVYAGPIYVVADDGEGGLCDLTDEQVEKYLNMFAEPEDISQDDVEADMGFRIY